MPHGRVAQQFRADLPEAVAAALFDNASTSSLEVTLGGMV